MQCRCSTSGVTSQRLAETGLDSASLLRVKKVGALLGFHGFLVFA
jgi:hypothetical protein